MVTKKSAPRPPEGPDEDNDLGFVPIDEYRDPFASRTPRTPRKKGHHGT